MSHADYLIYLSVIEKIKHHQQHFLYPIYLCFRLGYSSFAIIYSLKRNLYQVIFFCFSLAVTRVML